MGTATDTMDATWTPGTQDSEGRVAHAAGSIVMHDGQLYRCLQPHTGCGDPNWAPGSALSLWAPVDESTTTTVEPAPHDNATTEITHNTVEPAPQHSYGGASTAQQGGMIGIYDWTWTGARAAAPVGATIGVAFSGWAEVSNALAESASVAATLPGDKYLSIGGGNANGHLSAERLMKLNAAIEAGELAGYSGVCYDVEEADGGMAAAFSYSFSVAKANGLKVLVTVSHSAPYAVPDKVLLMASFFNDSNIDFISPQLYTSGQEVVNDYAWDGVEWAEYAKSKAAIVPSIVRAELFDDAKDFFANQLINANVAILGFIQWAQ